MPKFTIEGTGALKKALEDAMKKEAIKEAVKVNGSELQRKMQRQTETAFKKGYSVGDTKRSISLTIKDSGFTAEVSAGTDYSPYLEYGTRFMEAEPFVRPAFNAQKGIFEQDIKKIVGE